MDEVARAWAMEALGARHVRDTRSLTFGTTSDLWLIVADDKPLVLRRYETNEIIDVLPRVVEYEAIALTAARSVLGTVVPEPIVFDADGAHAGRPSLVMTFLPGTPVIHALDPRRVASPLAHLHASAAPSDLPRYHHWFDAEKIAVPAWTRSPGAWAKLIEVVRGAQPEAQDVFLHRDYHPANLLWRGDCLSGVVDWPFSCRGPRGVDVAHTWSNLALVDGVAEADRFLDAYRELVPTYVHHLWWDVADLFSGDDGFSGVIAFNALGGNLDVNLLRTRVDDWAEALAAMV